MIAKRIPIQERFWGVVHVTAGIIPHAISFHRGLAIRRFLNDPRYGYSRHGSWRQLRRQGYRLVRLSITPLAISTEAGK